MGGICGTLLGGFNDIHQLFHPGKGRVNGSTERAEFSPNRLVCDQLASKCLAHGGVVIGVFDTAASKAETGAR